MELQIKVILFINMILLVNFLAGFILVFHQKWLMKKAASEPHECHCHICGRSFDIQDVDLEEEKEKIKNETL